MKKLKCIQIFLMLLTIRILIACWPYSGYNSPPMYGDFEAQRHWIEITSNLPVSHWYFYDLPYWGLDYPPLTAYHSLLLSKLIPPTLKSSFSLYTSRGTETGFLKIFMRSTVILSDFFTYLPAVYLCTKWKDRNIYYFTLLATIPALLLIDHGHFQYNNVMLGLFVYSVYFSRYKNFYAISNILAILSVAFKQMALFYIPVQATFLLAMAFKTHLTNESSINFLTKILIFSFATCFILLYPFINASRTIQFTEILSESVLFSPLPPLYPYPKAPTKFIQILTLQITQLIHRIFPFQRGIFEDKVANFWCTFHNLVYKINRIPLNWLKLSSLILTITFSAPTLYSVYRNPSKDRLFASFAAVAWAFFLFGFQVHEKSVLLPLIPTFLLILESDYSSAPVWVSLANFLATFSLFPLLARDGQAIPYFTLQLLWSRVFNLPPFNWRLLSESGRFVLLSHGLLYLSIIIWHTLEFFVQPPSSLPDLFVVTNAIISFGGFFIVYCWCMLASVSEKSLKDQLDSLFPRLAKLIFPDPLDKHKNTKIS